MERKDWKVVKLGDVCDIISGSTPKTKEPTFWEGKHFWITPAELKGDKWVSSTERTLTDEGVKNAHLQILPVGTVLLSSRAPIGKIAITTVPMYCNQGFKNLVCSDLLKNEYLYWYLLYKEEYIKSLGVGATFKEISKTIVASIPIPVPPLPVQARIVDELDCLQGILSKKRQQLAEYHSLAQAIFHQMFGDPVVNEKGWEVKRLGEGTSEMFIGPFGSSLKKDCYVQKHEAFCMIYEQKHAIKKTCNNDNHYINEEKYKQLERFTVRPGDFIMSCRGTIGEVFQLPQNAPIGIIHPSVMKIRLIPEIFHPTYFKNILNLIMKEQMVNGGCIKMAITAKTLAAIPIPLPPLSLQQSFAARIAAIDSQRERLAASIRELETLLACRMETLLNCPQA